MLFQFTNFFVPILTLYKNVCFPLLSIGMFTFLSHSVKTRFFKILQLSKHFFSFQLNSKYLLRGDYFKNQAAIKVYLDPKIEFRSQYMSGLTILRFQFKIRLEPPRLFPGLESFFSNHCLKFYGLNMFLKCSRGDRNNYTESREIEGYLSSMSTSGMLG